MIKVEVREEIRKELVTRDIFESLGKEIRERFNVVDEKFKGVDEKLESLEDRMDEKFKSLNFKLNLFFGRRADCLDICQSDFCRVN